MKRIIIEVSETTAKRWKNVSPKMKSYLEKIFGKQIDAISQDEKEVRFEDLLNIAREEAAKNGLSEEVLQQLLNEE